MERIFRVKTNEGFKEFLDENEANAFEADLELKKSAKLKKEEENKKALAEINEILKVLNNSIIEYEKSTGKKLWQYYGKDGNYFKEAKGDPYWENLSKSLQMALGTYYM
jgi:hypothetical protein